MVADPDFCLAGPYPDPEGQNAEFLHKNLPNRFFFHIAISHLIPYKSFCVTSKKIFVKFDNLKI